MAKAVKGSGKLQCSFCGKSQDDVRKLIAGPTVYICDECIELCNDIIAEEWEEEKGKGLSQLPKPAEIKAILDQYVVGQDRAKKTLVSMRSSSPSPIFSSSAPPAAARPCWPRPSPRSSTSPSRSPTPPP
jgi:hypothetical protein